MVGVCRETRSANDDLDLPGSPPPLVPGSVPMYGSSFDIHIHIDIDMDMEIAIASSHGHSAQSRVRSYYAHKPRSPNYYSYDSS
jgi:hypothetical protein